MGSTGDSYDNALAEALNSLYKAELIYNEARPGYAGPWRDRREVERETAAWVHWYNTRRPTSPWAASHHNKQKTNTQQHERKRPQQASTKTGTWQTVRGPLYPLRGAAPVMWRYTRTEGV